MKNIKSCIEFGTFDKLFEEINAMFYLDFHYCLLYPSTARQDPLRQRNTNGYADGNCSLLSVNQVKEVKEI